MVVTRILGGLGNQMFQYAFGRSVAIKHNERLALDISGFENYILHNGFELNRLFDIQAEMWGLEQLHQHYGWKAWPGIWKLLQLQSSFLVTNEFLIQDIRVSAKSYKGVARPRTYLKGYWQCEFLFSDYADQIRKDFTFTPSMNSENQEWAQRINECESISLHVRRGDYVKNPKTLATHGLCTLDYYQKALHHLGDRINAPVIFVFSDEPDWVKSHLDIPFPHYFVTNNKGSECYNDMRLMSLCQHHIIANSSFSWWGAWLNPNQGKIVIAPKSWFSNSSLSQDAVPPTWIKI